MGKKEGKCGALAYIYIKFLVYIFYISNYKLYNWERKEGEYALAFHVYIRIVEMIYISWNYKLYNCRREEEGKRMLAFIELYVCIVEMILFIYTYRISSMYRITNCTIEERKENASCGRGDGKGRVRVSKSVWLVASSLSLRAVAPRENRRDANEQIKG